jgi:hypothetical protein
VNRVIFMKKMLNWVDSSINGLLDPRHRKDQVNIHVPRVVYDILMQIAIQQQKPASGLATEYLVSGLKAELHTRLKNSYSNKSKIMPQDSIQSDKTRQALS